MMMGGEGKNNGRILGFAARGRRAGGLFGGGGVRHDYDMDTLKCSSHRVARWEYNVRSQIGVYNNFVSLIDPNWQP